MPANQGATRPHILWNLQPAERVFRSPQSGRSGKPPEKRDRPSHGGSLTQQLAAVAQGSAATYEAQRDAGDPADGFGLLLEFESFPGLELIFESLGRDRQGIAVRSVQHEGNLTRASVWVPRAQLQHFEKLLAKYIETGRGQSLVDSIRFIREATLRDLWTDDLRLFPQDPQRMLSWEVWLPTLDQPDAEVRFRRHAQTAGIVVERAVLHFAERAVLWARGSLAQWQQSLPLLLCVAELRKAKETADFFDSLTPTEQREWADDLLQRTDIPAPGADVPHVCVLDTGLTRGHPLLAPAAAAADLHTLMADPADVADTTRDGHGNPMAGLALWGDLQQVLEGRQRIALTHRLESVKLLREGGANEGTAQQHGYWTQEAVYLPEIAAATRKRVFCLTVSTEDGRDMGRPSSWSAAVDALAYGVDSDGEAPRLICVSAGNIREPAQVANYPESQRRAQLCDPAQAWNALTVGAYTEKLRITERDARDLNAVAPEGGLSPFSRTTLDWDNQWPLKPDIVMEGGNAGSDGHNAFEVTSLSLLSTFHRPQERRFTGTNATSAATALAARMAAQLQAEYPDLWPETIRGLMAHSASWTPAMLRAVSTGTPGERNRQLLRQFGHGVPDLQLARYSAGDSLTLIVQGELQPFFRDPDDGGYKTYHMHLHQLPWPVDELAALEETEVQLRVTLSTFVEPNPSERGFSGRYRYAGHGLRFRLRDAAETPDEFIERVNKLDRQPGVTPPGGRVSEAGWTLGYDLAGRGSLIADTWTGTARDLASRYVIAVYPTIGWWRERHQLQRHLRSVRYALLVSIRAPGVETDLYAATETAVAARVQAATAVTIETP